jgi:predicted acetyltransferase
LQVLSSVVSFRHVCGRGETIERHGGAIEDVRETELGLTRRYWIDLTLRSATA